MKRILFLFVVAVGLCCCGLYAPVSSTKKQGDVNKYVYVYVIPTSGVTTGAVAGSASLGFVGGETVTINPSEVMSGYLMQQGYTVLPSIEPELADKTMIASYGYLGRFYVGFFEYASKVIIQFRDARTQELIASCEAEGTGGNQFSEISNAINTALNNIFRP